MFPCACKVLLRSRAVFSSNVHRILSAGYKSQISLDKLYPKRYQKNDKIPNTTILTGEREKFSGVIPLDEVQIKACRSSGPGGQHVNKVNTKVEMRFNIDEALWIPDWIKPRLKEQQPNRVTKNGEFVVTSEKTRKQILNQADCLDKIRNMIFQASVMPTELTPEQKALIEKREEAANKRRVEDKRRRSILKQVKQNMNTF